jgi:sulfofructose kinase
MAGATRALVWARAQGCLSELDADIAPQEDLATLVPLAHWAVFSEPGLGLWAPGCDVTTALREACHQGAQRSAVTLGAQGVVFHGALAVALARGMPDHAAFRYASAAAALKCTQSGGARGAPTHKALNEFMKGLP